MEEEVKFVLDTAKEAMESALEHLEKQLRNIRAGKASPQMVQGVMVEYYGSPTPLSQVANVNTPDGMTISIQPWEKGIIPEIEKAILKANLDRKSTRLNSSHVAISYAVFCLKKKTK